MPMRQDYESLKKYSTFSDITTELPTILDKINGKPRPSLPPNQKWEIARFCPFRGFILDLGGTEFAIPFYSVQDCSYETFFAY